MSNHKGDCIDAQKEMDLGQMKSSSISQTLYKLYYGLDAHCPPQVMCWTLGPQVVALPWKVVELLVG